MLACRRCSRWACASTPKVGVRLNAEGAGGTGDATVARRNPVLGAISSVIFAVVLIAVTIAVLYVARDFIGQHTGAYILGAKHN